MSTDSLPASPGGVIHDLGYRRYEGQRLGRGAIFLALYWYSLRSAFGIGRGAKAKIVPILMFAVMCLPAIVNVVSMARGGGRIVEYDTYTPRLRTLVMLIFVAAQAPELVSRDLRSHVLPLYMSRPLRRVDYPAAKYAAFTTACLLVLEIPLIVLYLGTIVSVHGGHAVWLQTMALIPGLGLGLAWAVLLAAIGLALACLAVRRAFATGGLAVYFFLTWVLASILTGIAENGPPGAVLNPPLSARLGGLISPFTVLDGVRQWLGGTSPGPIPAPGSAGAAYGVMYAALLVISLWVLDTRYRRVAVS